MCQNWIGRVGELMILKSNHTIMTWFSTIIYPTVFYIILKLNSVIMTRFIHNHILQPVHDLPTNTKRKKIHYEFQKKITIVQKSKTS